MLKCFSNPSRRHARTAVRPGCPTVVGGFGVFVLAVLIACCSTAFGDSAPIPAASMLYLHDGDFLGGRLDDCDVANVVRWQAKGATQPFEFPAGAVRAAYFAPPAAASAPEGDYCFELSDGDLLYGSLVNVTPEQFEIQSPQLGQLHVARDQVCRLTPYSDSSKSEYRGPNGLAEWRPSGEQWNEEAGRLVSYTPHAEVQKELVIPDRARIEFEIAWNDIPEFAFVLAAGGTGEQLKSGYRFEVWNRTLVLVRAGKVDGDVAIIADLNSSTDRIHFEAFYDQATGTLSVHSLDGKQLAEITVLEQKGTPLRLVSLTNLGTNVRLEQLTIGPWSGKPPTQVDVDKPRVQMTDGTIVYGEVIGYHADAKQFVLRGEDSEEKFLDAAQVACVVPIAAAKPGNGSFRVGLHNGSRFSGELTKVADGKVYISRRGVEEPLTCAVADVRSLVGLNSNDHAVHAPARVGRLELEGARSHGTLVEAAATGDDAKSCLVWQPLSSTTGSPLDRLASGRIVYRDPPPPPPKLTQQERELQRVQQRRRPQPAPGVVGAVLRVLSGDQAVDVPALPKPHGAGTLYLLAGDRIPCDVSEIDEEGVHFKSAVVTSTFVPHSGVKALEFAPDWTAAALDDVKRERLLTLPRMQKGNPPTHLIVSTTGDYLRARLTAMTADTLTLETRLDTKQIPRNRVACLIWLHDASDAAPPNSPGSSPPAADDSPGPLRVQAVQSDGVRLTFDPQECTGKALSGTSKLLGACSVDLNLIDAIVFGSMIGNENGERSYRTWKLTDAVEPRYIRDAAQGGAGDRPPGSESGLVGKKAPDFHLDLLEGGKFNVAAEKGHVVVLDFWASWCGPCMQAMPQVDAVVEEFASRGVTLVAVNMQEDRAAASSALERLKIHPAVALDVDGATAEHYQVTAIPQTVVIDAAGNVAQVFIGGGLDFPTQLRAAIENAMAPSTPP
jgi:thiol-disulfide isomerase/thioredoxin